MRLRNVKGSREKIETHKSVVIEEEATSNKGNWNNLFQKKQPIYIEIGMGKGRFIHQQAKNNPHNNYIGIEKFSSVLVRAIERYDEEPLENLIFIRMDAEALLEVFNAEEITGIYLNFSDPWPKDRHAKRRLTHEGYWKRYGEVLKADGEVVFKTDNRVLFDFSVEQIEIAKWHIKNITYDLHHSEYMDGNIMTEYEEKFSQKGNPIHRVVATR